MSSLSPSVRNLARDYEKGLIFNHDTGIAVPKYDLLGNRHDHKPLLEPVVGRATKFSVLWGREEVNYEHFNVMKLHPVVALNVLYKGIKRLREQRNSSIIGFKPKVGTPQEHWKKYVVFMKEMISFAHMIQIPDTPTQRTQGQSPRVVFIFGAGFKDPDTNRPMTRAMVHTSEWRLNPSRAQYSADILLDPNVLDLVSSILTTYPLAPISEDLRTVLRLVYEQDSNLGGPVRLGTVGPYSHAKQVVFNDLKQYKNDILPLIDYIEQQTNRRPSKKTLLPTFFNREDNAPVFMDLTANQSLVDENNNNNNFGHAVEDEVVNDADEPNYTNLNEITDNVEGEENESPDILEMDEVLGIEPVVDRQTGEVISADGTVNETAAERNEGLTELHNAKKRKLTYNVLDRLQKPADMMQFKKVKLDKFISASGMMWNCKDIYFNGRVPQDGLVLSNVFDLKKVFYDDPNARITTGVRLGNYVYIKAIHTKITWKLFSGDSANVRFIIGYYNGNPKDQIDDNSVTAWVTNEAGELIGINLSGLSVDAVLEKSPHIDIQNLEDEELPNYMETPTNFSPYNFINYMLEDQFIVLFDNYADLNVQAINEDGVEIVGEGGEVSWGCSYKVSRNVKLDDLDLEVVYSSDSQVPYFGNIFYLLIGDYEGGVVQATMWSRIYYIS